MDNKKEDTHLKEGWTKGVLSGSKLAVIFFVGIFVCKVGWSFGIGEFEFSFGFILNIASTILEDMLFGYLGDLIFPAVGVAVILIVTFVWSVMVHSLPLWLYLLRVTAFFSVLFGLSYAASFANGPLPEWALIMGGIIFWAILFSVAGILGFGAFSRISGRNTRLY